MGKVKALDGREKLKWVAKEIREYLKAHGGTYGVRVQQNNVIWISGGFTFGVHYTERQMKEQIFHQWLLEAQELWDLQVNISSMHIWIKEGEPTPFKVLTDDEFVDRLVNEDDFPF